jgi:Co/Zn/Cd efflux system component
MHHDQRSEHVHDHVFLGDAHDVHEKRTRCVVALTAGMMVVEIRRRARHLGAGHRTDPDIR